MPFRKLLIANRGEIAIRISRAAGEAGLACVAIHPADDVSSLHVRTADESHEIPGRGARAYLDIEAVIAAAKATGCDALHPGYGFLSENVALARRCAEEAIVFIGPSPEALELFGDKAKAKALAKQCGVPVIDGTEGPTTLEEARAFLASQGAVMIKAIAGGGGRGMRMVDDPAKLDEAYARCQSEAMAAFGSGEVYAERLIRRARHIEVQIVGDRHGAISHLWERECTIQRRNQKLIEVAPSPSLSEALRARIIESAKHLAAAAQYDNLGTFEFLVDDEASGNDERFAFIEANPRLQVEHTVTEAVTGVDLVATQIAIAAGQGLAALGLDPAAPPPARGIAVQWRINAERLDAEGQAMPTSGQLRRCDFAAGPGVRVDTQARPGLSPSPHYDTLLAKLIVHHGAGGEAGWHAVLRRSRRALAECHIEGIATNLALLRVLAAHEDVATHAVHTRWLEAAWPVLQPRLAAQSDAGAEKAVRSGAHVAAPPALHDDTPPAGLSALRAPMAGRLVHFSPEADGDAALAAGTEVLVLEAMKMQHGITLSHPARVAARRVHPGDFVQEGQILLWLAAADEAQAQGGTTTEADPDYIRPDLQRALARIALTHDSARPDAVSKRHAQGGRTARENIADLCDPGSFQEYGGLAIAAQQRRRSLDDLQRNTPADGMVTGVGAVNGALFGPERSRTAVLAYDYTVLAGTQGWRNHHKKDRLLKVIHDASLPTVLFAEGGGGRPGDVDMPIVAGLNNHTFSRFADLSGRVPVLGVVHGRCFAGNAALLGCCDTIIATQAANIGMGGPAMIEGGGLGVFKPEEIGPAAELARNGVVDVLVEDEAQAVAVARHYLSYFQGPLPEGQWRCSDPRRLRHSVPENRLRAYDMRALIATLADTGSVLELRAGFGAGMITALVRFAGRPMALIANNPQHLGGAIDPEASDKGARFLQLAQSHGLPVLSLCDTPGFMVGPEVERQAQVRHACRLFLTAAKLTVPAFTVVVRKGYGLGAQAMAMGGFDAPVFTVAWPTGEFGGMGLEGAVRLGFRKELEAASAGPERDELYRRLVEQQYAAGSALNMAQTLEIDAVIDPAETRDWIIRGLQGAPVPPRSARGLRFIDGW